MRRPENRRFLQFGERGLREVTTLRRLCPEMRSAVCGARRRRRVSQISSAPSVTWPEAESPSRTKTGAEASEAAMILAASSVRKDGPVVSSTDEMMREPAFVDCNAPPVLARSRAASRSAEAVFEFFHFAGTACGGLPIISRCRPELRAVRKSAWQPPRKEWRSRAGPLPMPCRRQRIRRGQSRDVFRISATRSNRPARCARDACRRTVGKSKAFDADGTEHTFAIDFPCAHPLPAKLGGPYRTESRRRDPQK